MNNRASQLIAICCILLMFGGLVFLPLLGAVLWNEYHGFEIVNVATPISGVATYEPIPTIPGHVSATQPPTTSTAEPPTESPTATNDATDAPVSTSTPTEIPAPTVTDTPSPPPTSTPTNTPTATPTVTQTPEVLCPTAKGQVLLISGTTTLPVASDLALLYDGVYVGGGTVKPGGIYNLYLAKAPPIAGLHTISIVLRGTETHRHPTVVRELTCIIR